MLEGIVVAVIGSCIGSWLILRTVHALDRHQANKHRAELEKKLAAKGQTMRDLKEHIAVRQIEEQCNGSK